MRCPVREGVIAGNGFRYQYRCMEEGTTYVFNGGGKRPCFVLRIDPIEKSAILLDLVRVDPCSMNSGATMKAAAKAAFALAQEVGVQRITLTDNSTKRLDNERRFSLADMYFLSSGKTWYESFLPIRPVASQEAEIDRRREKIRTNTWDAIISCLREVHPDATIPVDISDIDTSASGSAMAVFSRIKSARTDFFAKYRIELPSCSGISSLFETDWYYNY